MNPQTKTTAFLYTRVSTEEQSLKGNSLKIQQDILYHYCQLHDIAIEKEFCEHYSAKTFKRPQWEKLMVEIEKTKMTPDVVLFTRWDRFSRNTGEAYHVIKCLQSLGVNTQAIEQPLDLSIPENKMMLAFYLAIPEVENDRRGLNIRNGIRKAKECGKWVGPAPLGYINHTYSNGSKAIVQREPEASIIRKVFMKLALGKCKVSFLYEEAREQGLKCSKSHFWNIIKNPVYAGKIRSQLNNKESFITYGNHIGVVTEEVFDKVQLFFAEDKRAYCIGFRPKLPFRGYIKCPICGKNLTGSGSKGRKLRYFYYHCTRKCKYRIRASTVFNWFLVSLSKLKLSGTHFTHYQDTFKRLTENRLQDLETQNHKASMSMDIFLDRIAKAKELMLNQEISFESYCEIKRDCESKIEALSKVINSCSKKIYMIVSTADSVAKEIFRLHDFYCNLNEENREVFLRLTLLRSSVWINSDGDNIFKIPFNDLFKRRDGDIGSENDSSITKEIAELLHQLSLLQLDMV